MEYTKEQVQERLKDIQEWGSVVFPEGFEHVDGCSLEITVGVPHDVYIYKTYDSGLGIRVKGYFGADFDGDAICEMDDLTDSEIMSLLEPTEAQKAATVQLKALEGVIADAARAYTDFAKENGLNGSVEWSTDIGTIEDWNSSRC